MGRTSPVQIKDLKRGTGGAPRSLIVRGGVYAAGGAIFAAGSLPTRAKIVSLQICRPEIACDFRQI